MNANRLINGIIPILKPTDTAQRALDLMEELQLHFLPIEDGMGVFRGMAEEDKLLDLYDTKALFADIYVGASGAYTYANEHFYEILRVAQSNKTDIIAVLDEDNKIIGSVLLKEVINHFAQSYAIQQEGGIIVLSMSQVDYSLAEVSRLVESNNAKILTMFVEADEKNPFYLQLTIKINQTDISRVVATFERFGYKIIEKFATTTLADVDYSRLDMLLKYYV